MLSAKRRPFSSFKSRFSFSRASNRAASSAAWASADLARCKSSAFAARACGERVSFYSSDDYQKESDNSRHPTRLADLWFRESGGSWLSPGWRLERVHDRTRPEAPGDARWTSVWRKRILRIETWSREANISWSSKQSLRQSALRNLQYGGLEERVVQRFGSSTALQFPMQACTALWFLCSSW